MSGRLRLTSRRNGCICCGASPSSGFAARTSDAGFDAAHGAWNQSMSEFDSTLPGTSAGETNSSASARKASAARKPVIAAATPRTPAPAPSAATRSSRPASSTARTRTRPCARPRPITTPRSSWSVRTIGASRPSTFARQPGNQVSASTSRARSSGLRADDHALRRVRDDAGAAGTAKPERRRDDRGRTRVEARGRHRAELVAGDRLGTDDEGPRNGIRIRIDPRIRAGVDLAQRQRASTHHPGHCQQPHRPQRSRRRVRLRAGQGEAERVRLGHGAAPEVVVARDRRIVVAAGVAQPDSACRRWRSAA